MDDSQRLVLIAEAVRYCQRVKAMGMPPSCYSKALREPVFFLWERRQGSKASAARFRSVTARGLTFGRGLLVYDHAIPFKYIRDELLALDPVTPATVRDTLTRFNTAVLITKAEDVMLTEHGYRNTMPEDWDGIDPLARYKAVGIQLEENV
jgi:hypothetical protein